jgi:hypothetical protein
VREFGLVNSSGSSRPPWWPAILVGSAALLAAGLAIAANLATSLVPLDWVKSHAAGIWVVFAILALLTAVLTVVTARSRQENTVAVGPPVTLTDPTDSQVVGDVLDGVVAGRESVVVTGSGSVHINRGTIDQDRTPDAPAQVVVGNIPARPEAFQDRAAIAQLAAAWEAGERVAVVHAITGGRGVGKTQAAAAYARQRAKEGWPVVAWISAEGERGLLSDLAALATAVGVADPMESSDLANLSISAMRNSAVSARRFLEAFVGPGLLIFDNATDPDRLAPFVPSVGDVQVVITSTDRAFASVGRLIDIDVFTAAESLVYLRERTHLPDDKGASVLANDLGYLPLALAQAATLITAQGLGYATYRDRLHRFPLEKYLIRRPGDPYPKGAAEAILLSVQDVERRDASGLVRKILRLMSVAPTGMSVSHIRVGLTDKYRTEQDMPSDEEIDAVLGRLVEASILNRTGHGLSMHRLIGRVISDRELALGNPIKWEWAGREASSGPAYAIVEGLVAMRDSKGPRATTLLFSLTEWEAFLEGVRNGEFDFPE